MLWISKNVSKAFLISIIDPLVDFFVIKKTAVLNSSEVILMSWVSSLGFVRFLASFDGFISFLGPGIFSLSGIISTFFGSKSCFFFI